MRRTIVLLAVVALAWFTAADDNEDRILQVYNNVVVGDYEAAVSKTRDLQRQGRGHLITKAVERLVSNNIRNTIEYAYKLWSLEARDIVRERFPIQFRLILGENAVKLIYHRDNLAMKLEGYVDNMGDRLAFGDANDKTSNRISWKFIPLWDDRRTYFKIVNLHRNQYLKLGVEADGDGEHKAYGDSGTDTFRHHWYLRPANLNGEMVFFIHNREYHHCLKLARAVDSDGDRLVWGHKGCDDSTPQILGVHVKAY